MLNQPSSHLYKTATKIPILFLEIPREVDFNLPGGRHSYILRHNITSTQSFTLNVWVRFQKNKASTFLTLFNAKNASNFEAFLQINHDSIRLLGDLVPFNKSIADGYWHYVAVAVNTLRAHRRIILNDKTLDHSDVESMRNKTMFDPSGTLAIGLVYNSALASFEDSGFAGQFSQLSISNKRYVPEMYNCSYNATGIALVILSSEIGFPNFQRLF